MDSSITDMLYSEITLRAEDAYKGEIPPTDDQLLGNPQQIVKEEQHHKKILIVDDE